MAEKGILFNGDMVRAILDDRKKATRRPVTVPWHDEWIQQVFEACNRAPWHTYIFLTKNPKRYANAYLFKDIPPKFMVGTTITGLKDNLKVPSIFDWISNSFLSIEPLLGSVDGVDFKKLSWVIVGAQTGPGAVKPKPEWVQSIIEQCRAANVPLFLKDNLGWHEKIQGFPVKNEARG